MTAILIYLGIGLVAGFMAGLLGVGGGMIIVPSLILGFAKLGLTTDFSFHIALGTSLASITFTSLSSIKAHHARGYVRWDIVKRIVLGILLGTFAGAQLVGYLPAKPLQWIFMLFLSLVACQMIFGLQTKPIRQLPDFAGMTAVGAGIGFLSSFIGMGGGALSVPFMHSCNTPPREAIGTSAAIGLPIAFAGAVGNMISGVGLPNLPPWSIGFVYLPALFFIVIASMPMAQVGARVAHCLPVALLKKIFAMMLIGIALRMLYSLN